MFQFKRTKYISLCFYGIFSLTLVVLLGALFPTPYFYVNYDVEPTYFSNIVCAYINGYTLDFIHPGVPIVYISSLFLSALPFNEDPEYLLLLSRIVIMVINFSLIYLGLLFIARTSLLCTILFLSFLFIFPASNYFIDILSPNGILIGVGLIVSVLGLKLGEPESSKATFLAYSLALAFAVSIKFHSILLVIPFLVASFFLKKNDASSASPILLVCLTAVMFFCFFGIFAFPILPMIPFWVTQFDYLYLTLYTILEGIRGIELWGHIGGLIFVVVLMFFAKRINLFEKIKAFRKNTTYKPAYIFVSGIFLLAIVYNLISVSLAGVAFNEIGRATRQYLPFLGFLVLFLPRSEAEEKIKLTTLVASVVLIALIALKGYRNQELYKFSSKIDLEFRGLIEESLSDRDYAVFFPNAYFISKELFMVFSDYRYGETKIMFEEQEGSLPFKLDPKLKSLRILNSRQFGSPRDVSSKFSYRYINKLLSLKYLPDSHRGVLENSMFYFKNKDICSEPYKSFNPGDTFSLFVPDDLTYLEIESRYEYHEERNLQIKTEGLPSNKLAKESGKARKFIDTLTNTWQKRCGFEILDRQEKIINNKRLHIIEVSSRPKIKS
jgi:hypothetical protein